jgi:hypothetical protein
MEYIGIPNLPEGPVSLAVADGRISLEAERTLLLNGTKLIKTSRHSGVHEAISYHPDIMFHHIGFNHIVFAPGTDDAFLNVLSGLGFNLIKGSSVLSSKYPHDIAYNAARVGTFFFHNLKYTDVVLKKELEACDISPVRIEQGYAKCSISIVNDSSIITADAGIARAAEKKGIDVLLIDFRQKILLPGLNYGFIGGCSGLIGKNMWAVNGDVEKLTSFKEIYDFLSRKDIQIISLSNEQVTDIGSIIPLITNKLL